MKIKFLFLVPLFAACTAVPNEEVKNEQTKLYPAEKEKIQQTAVSDTKAQDENAIFFDDLVAYKDRINEYGDKTSEAFWQKLKERMQINPSSDLYRGYKLHHIGKNLYLVDIGTRWGCAASTCMGFNTLVLWDKYRGLLQKKEIEFSSTDSPSSINLDIIANSIAYYKIEESVYEHDELEFSRGIKFARHEYTHHFFWISSEDLIDLEKADKNTLRRARNLIYAWHGYKFKSEDLQEYFSKFDWYNPIYDSEQGLLSEKELEVANLIKKLEDTL